MFGSCVPCPCYNPATFVRLLDSCWEVQFCSTHCGLSTHIFRTWHFCWNRSLVWVGPLDVLSCSGRTLWSLVHMFWLSSYTLWELVRSVTFLMWPLTWLATLWPSTNFCAGGSLSPSSLYCSRRESSAWCSLLWLSFIFPTSFLKRLPFLHPHFHHAPSGWVWEVFAACAEIKVK